MTEVKVNTFKLNKDIENLSKLGLSEDLATVCACANNNVPEMADHIIVTLKDEQELLSQELKHLEPLESNIVEITETVAKSNIDLI